MSKAHRVIYRARDTACPGEVYTERCACGAIRTASGVVAAPWHDPVTARVIPECPGVSLKALPEIGRTYRGNPKKTKFHARVRSVTRTAINTWVDYDKIDPETGLVWDTDGRRKLRNFQVMYPAPLEDGN
jgi:hypothetical protein